MGDHGEFDEVRGWWVLGGALPWDLVSLGVWIDMSLHSRVRCFHMCHETSLMLKEVVIQITIETPSEFYIRLHPIWTNEGNLVGLNELKFQIKSGFE